MNKTLAIAIAALSLLTFQTASARPVEPPEERRFIIEKDNGGEVDKFVTDLKYAKKIGMKFEVVADCASACTLILSKDYDLDVCVREKVRFGFHKPYAMGALGNIVRNIRFAVNAEKMWREDFYDKYPKFVQEKIDQRGVPSVIQGDLPSDVLWLTYDDVKAHLKTCL